MQSLPLQSVLPGSSLSVTSKRLGEKNLTFYIVNYDLKIVHITDVIKLLKKKFI